MLKKPVFNVKSKLLRNFNFSQFHEHVFRSGRTQPYSDFTILRIKKRLQHRLEAATEGVLSK